MGFSLYATENTADFLRESGVACEKVYKISTGKEPGVGALLASGTLDLIINIPSPPVRNSLPRGHVGARSRAGPVRSQGRETTLTESEASNGAGAISNGASAFATENTDGFTIRRKAVDMNIPLITNRQLAEAFVMALAEQNGNGLKAKSWAEY
jgi:carbamoyl-phosphate synthase large subunit